MAQSVFHLDTVSGVPSIWEPHDEPKLSHEDSLAFPIVGRLSEYNPDHRAKLAKYDVVIRSSRGQRSAFLFRDQGRDAIAPVLGDDVGWYEAIVDGERWHRMFVIRELDLLDREHSWMEPFPGGKVWPIHKYVAFKPEAVEETAFVLEGWNSSHVFLGEALAMKIRALAIRGLEVKKDWTLGQTFDHMNRPPATPDQEPDPEWSEQPDATLAGFALTLSTQGATLLGVDEDAPPKALVEAIDKHLERLHTQCSELSETDNLKLGSLYCEQFRRAADWEWTTICHTSNDHGFTPAVVAPDRSHAVLAEFVVGAALEELVDEGVPMTLIGSFVLAKAGKLQPQPANSYVLLW